MRRRHSAPDAREAGQAVIEGVIACVIALNVAMAGIDLGKYALAWASCDQAATEACRTLMADPGAIPARPAAAPEKARAAALAASPNLDSGLTSLTVERTADTARTYTHRFSAGGGGSTVERESTADTHRAKLTLATSTKALTWVGALLGAGADGRYEIKVERTFEYDTTALPAGQGGGRW